MNTIFIVVNNTKEYISTKSKLYVPGAYESYKETFKLIKTSLHLFEKIVMLESQPGMKKPEELEKFIKDHPQNFCGKLEEIVIDPQTQVWITGFPKDTIVAEIVQGLLDEGVQERQFTFFNPGFRNIGTGDLGIFTKCIKGGAKIEGD